MKRSNIKIVDCSDLGRYKSIINNGKYYQFTKDNKLFSGIRAWIYDYHKSELLEYYQNGNMYNY